MKSASFPDKRFLVIAGLLLFVLLALGCAHPRLPHRADLSISELDTRCLKDKVIIIDPGHGGPERGAIGVRGINEAEVNLTVALHLWGLLKQTGARPLLTRSSDQALHSAKEYNLAVDLGLRKQKAAHAGADLFVSIHHNASLNRSENSLIVFYAMADPYRSRDAARAIAAALQNRLQSDRHSVKAGNYTVLRSLQAPAILGEASFISNKKNEQNLAYSRTLAAEARGYFDGILDFFSRGTPTIRTLRAAAPETVHARPPIRACLDPGIRGERVDAGSITAAIDGKPVRRIKADQNCIEITPPELSNGSHRACVAFRNTRGNSAQKCIDVNVALPPHSLALTSSFSTIPPSPLAVTSVDMYVRDRLGRPVLDGTPVTITTSAGTLLQAESRTTEGHARALLAAEKHAATALLNASSGNARAEKHITFAMPDKALLALSVRDTNGQALSNVALKHASQTLAFSDHYGHLQAEIDNGQDRFQIVKQGYEPYTLRNNPPVGSMTKTSVVLRIIDEGIFFNRTIMLDPEGTSAAALPVLKILQDKIERAGGRAPLTWQEDPAPPYVERVMRASSLGADVFLCVSADKRRCNTGYYHRSAPGRALALSLWKTFADRGLSGWRKCVISHSTHDAILHTSMPAVELGLSRRITARNPEAVAQAIYEALRLWLRDPTPKRP